MKLTKDEVRTSNNIFKHLISTDPKTLKEFGIERCIKCNGSGLLTHKNKTGSYTWDTSSYCDECKSLGYITIGRFKISDIFHKCKNCGGIGCEDCGYDGVVDWVKNLMGGRL